MKKKTIIIIAVVLIIAVIVILNLSSQREKSVKVTIEKVKKTDLTSIISASGEMPGRCATMAAVERSSRPAARSSPAVALQAFSSRPKCFSRSW